MILYFSGTGNSQACAQYLGKGLQDTVTNIFPYVRQGRGDTFVSEHPWVFVAPIYAWKLPRLMVEFIKKSTFQGNQKAYFVLTCGQEMGNAGVELEQLCRKKGLTYQGAFPVPMPDNYIVLFDSPTQEEMTAQLKEVPQKLDRACTCIQWGNPFPALSTTLVDKLKSGPVNMLFYQCFLKDKKFFSTNACVGCGKCAHVCVYGNITIEAGRPVWNGKCTHCMACISQCPVQAIEYGKKTKGKKRYLCPQVETGWDMDKG